jgi:hypothetical protein
MMTAGTRLAAHQARASIEPGSDHPLTQTTAGAIPSSALKIKGRSIAEVISLRFRLRRSNRLTYGLAVGATSKQPNGSWSVSSSRTGGVGAFAAKAEKRALWYGVALINTQHTGPDIGGRSTDADSGLGRAA